MFGSHPAASRVNTSSKQSIGARPRLLLLSLELRCFGSLQWKQHFGQVQGILPYFDIGPFMDPAPITCIKIILWVFEDPSLPVLIQEFLRLTSHPSLSPLTRVSSLVADGRSAPGSGCNKVRKDRSHSHGSTGTAEQVSL